MKAFDQLLTEDIAAYEGRHDDLIFQAPAFYRMLVALLDDSAVPRRLRPLLIAAIAYFILPSDIIPEDIHGPYGYVDDIFLCAWVADQLRRELDNEDVLVANWDGEGSVTELIADILRQEKELIGDQRQRMLAYAGFPYVLAGK